MIFYVTYSTPISRNCRFNISYVAIFSSSKDYFHKVRKPHSYSPASQSSDNAVPGKQWNKLNWFNSLLPSLCSQRNGEYILEVSISVIPKSLLSHSVQELKQWSGIKSWKLLPIMKVLSTPSRSQPCCNAIRDESHASSGGQTFSENDPLQKSTGVKAPVPSVSKYFICCVKPYSSGVHILESNKPDIISSKTKGYIC